MVYRWKRDRKTGEIMKVAGKKKLEFLAIQRTDNKEWAIPGVRTSTCTPWPLLWHFFLPFVQVYTATAVCVFTRIDINCQLTVP